MTIDVPTNLPAPSLPPAGRITPLDAGGGARRTRRVLGDTTGQPAVAGTMTTQALDGAMFGSV